MTQSGQRTLYDWPETTLGVVPSGPAPTGRQVRMISENLFVGPTLVDSPEITPGNEAEDQVNNGYAGGGEITIAFSPRNYDHWLEALLWNTWADPAGGATPVRTSGAATVTYTPTGPNPRRLTTSGTWTNTPAVGDKILVQGSSNAYLNSIHRVLAATSTDIDLEEDGIRSDAVRVPAIASGQNITIMRGQRLTNSLTPARRSIGFERRTQRTKGTFLGVTATYGAPVTDYSIFLAGLPTRFQMQSTGDSPFTGSFSWDMAQQVDGTATVMFGTSAYDSTPIFQGIQALKKVRFYVPGMSAVAGDAGIIEDTLRICPQSFSLEIANGLTTTPLMCAAPEKDYDFGEALMTIQISGIYDSPFATRAFNQQLEGIFELAMVATNGDGYLFRAPRAKVQVARADTPGRRQVIALNMTVKAFKQLTPLTGDSSRAVEIYRFRQP